MLTSAQRNDESLVNEFEWLQFSERIEMSPASVWVPDEEEKITNRPVKELKHLQATDASELGPYESAPRVRVLDESQVLPGEASFATVTLNRLSEQNIVKENVVAELAPPETGPRVRLLDESQVLPGEASFATVISKEPPGSRTYSPVTEFLARTNLNSRTLKVATLLAVAILVIATLIILEITTGVFSSRRTANTASHAFPPKTEHTNAQPPVLTTPRSSNSVAASDSQKQASQSRTPTPVPTKFDGATETIRKTFSERANSETSRKASSNDAKSETPRKASLQDAKSVASRGAPAGNSRHAAASPKKLRVSVKEPVVTSRATDSESSKVSNSRPATERKQHEASSLATDAAAVKPKGEPKAPPATGGAQRPRTVTP